MKDYDKKNAVYKYGDDEFVFDFHTSLTAEQKSTFVNSVTFLLVGDYYNYIIKDLIFDLFIVKTFTNISVSDILNSNTMLDDAESLLKNTNIVEIVMANAEYGLIDDLHQAVDLNVEYKTGIHRNIISESIVDLIKTFERKVGEFAIDSNSLMSMMDMLNGISGELTMDNILDAYAKSDMYKNNQSLIEEENKSEIIAD